MTDTVLALLRRIREGGNACAIRRGDLGVSFEELADGSVALETDLRTKGLRAGDVVVLSGDVTPASARALLALASLGAICVPVLRSSRAGLAEKVRISRATWRLTVTDDEGLSMERLEGTGDHALYEGLRGAGHPGLVLFTSGSTGEPKGAAHDLDRLLAKFLVPRPAWRTLALLVFDHWGGLNTLLHALSNGSPLVSPFTRNPGEICELVQAHRIELLPASPSFLNLLLVSRAYERHDLSSLKVISYGSEPMPPQTLKRLAATFPGVRLQQTYGLIELGVLRSRSRGADSLWVKLGGEGFETRVRDGMLEIKAESAMLGYLNAPSPFTEDGWFQTGDAVEVDGDYLRILGRRSELINVGGEKVYPTEVEGVIEEVENVIEATVWGEPNALVGRIVCARVRLAQEEGASSVVARVKAHCRSRMEAYKVPVRVLVEEESAVSERQKKQRPRKGVDPATEFTG